MVLLGAPGTGCSGSSMVASLDPPRHAHKHHERRGCPDARGVLRLCCVYNLGNCLPTLARVG